MNMRFPMIAAALFLCSLPCGAQIKYASGQNVVPVYEGWERNSDGSFNMVFGYMNRNYEEQVEVPVGAENMFEPGPADRGQPAHFYPRRQEYAFKIKVPQDWGDKDLVWTLTAHGKTEKAYGTLKPVWELSDLVYQENRGGPGELTYPSVPDEAPSIEMVGSAERTAVAGEPITLTVQISDDGRPVPRSRRPGMPAFGGPGRDGGGFAPKIESPVTQAVVRLDPGVRLGVTWVVYRGGPGDVTFQPRKVAVVNVDAAGSPAGVTPLSGKATTSVTFTKPGNYRLRAYADDGVLLTPLDVNVVVSTTRQ
jgi:hypothetical protein